MPAGLEEANGEFQTQPPELCEEWEEWEEWDA
jgi:hypothetical protein